MKTNYSVSKMLRLMMLFVLLLPSLVKAQTFVVGTGTTLNGTSSSPTPYGLYWTGEKQQYLILASELTALGATAGSINSVSFNVAVPEPASSGGNHMKNYSIKMKQTTSTALSTTWETGLTQVYTNVQYASITGWNLHTFTTPFVWDGVSNLIVEVCFDNYVAGYDYSSNATCYNSATPFVSYHRFGSDNGGVCASTSNSATGSSRPNMKFDILSVASDIDMRMLSWESPLTGGTTSATKPITVKFKNNGVLAQSNFPVKYSINGGSTWTTDTFTSTVNPGDTVTYTFPTTANMANPGIFACKATVKATGDTLILNDSIATSIYLCTSTLSGTYTIGADTASNYQSFAAVSSALLNCGLSGPVTFNIKPGTYTEQITLPLVNNPNAYGITFQSLTGLANDVIIQYDAVGSADNWVMKLNGTDNVTVKNLTFKALDATYGYNVVLASGCDNITITDNVFNCVNLTTSSSTAGVYDNALNDFNLVINNNKFNSGYYGAYLNGASSSSRQFGSVVTNNVMNNIMYSGIYLYYQDSTIVDKNIINMGAHTSTQYGMYNYYAYGTEITRNKINLSSTGTQYGIYRSYGDSTLTRRNLIANNFVSGAPINSTSQHGIYLTSCKAHDIYFNSVNTTGNNGSYGLYVSNSAANTSFNIYNNNIRTTIGYAAYITSNLYLLGADNNNFYTLDTNKFVYWGAQFYNLAALKATNANTNQLSLNVDPGYFTAKDLHVNNYYLDGAAYPINGSFFPFSNITNDIDGDVRNASTPDIGADEYTAIGIDAGITLFNSPATPCPGVADSVKVTLRNYGVLPLTACSVNWTVNNVNQAAYTFSGNIDPGMTQVVTIGVYTFAANTIHNLKFYTSGIADGNNLNDTLFVNGKKASLPAGTYTIGNDTLSTYATFAAAIDDMSANGICGPVVFEVKPGTYAGNFTLPIIPGSNAANTIVFKSQNNDKESVIVQHNALGSADNFVVRLNGADYVTFKGMTFKGLNSSYAKVFDFINASSYVTLEGNNILSLGTSSSNYGISFTSAVQDSFNTIKNNVIKNGYYGIYLYGNSSFKEYGNVIEGNEVLDFYYYGIYTAYQDSLTVKGNKVRNLPNNGTTYGLYLYYNRSSKYTNNNVVLNNGTSTSSVYGMYVYYNDTVVGRRGVVANNFVAITGSNSSTQYAIYIPGSGAFDVYYNTASVSGTYSGTSYAFYLGNTATGNAGSNVANNLFSNTKPGTGYAAYIANDTYLGYGDYNNYYTSGGTAFVYWGAARADFAALQLAFATRNLYSSNVDPKLTSPADGHLTFFSPNNSAMVIPAITTDIDGDVRSLTTPDMGADEWDPAAHDMKTSSLVTPVLTLCGNATDNVVAVFMNYSSSTETNVAVNCIINTPTGLVTKTGIIASSVPGQTDTVNMGSINTTTPGVYTFKTFASLATDLVHSNDTIVSTFTIDAPMAMPLMQDFNADANLWAGNMYRSTSLTSPTFFLNQYSTTTVINSNFTKKVGPITANGLLSFDYRITDYNTTNASILKGDSVRIQLSTDCGTSFQNVYVIDTFTHVPSSDFRHIILPIGSFAGGNVLLKIAGVWHAGDGDLDYHFDNIGISEAYPVALGTDKAICIGDSTMLDAGIAPTGYALTYDWYKQGDTLSLGANQTLYTAAAGTYYVNVSTQFGVVSSDTINVVVNALPVVTFSGLNDSYCLNATNGVLTGSPAGGTFTGTGMNAGTFEPLTAGIGVQHITYTYTDLNTCTASAMDSTEVLAIPVYTISNDTSICLGTSATLAVSDTGYTYLWSNAAATQSNTVSPSANQYYSVQVSNANLCSVIDSAMVSVLALPVVNLGADTSICESNSINLNAGTFTSYLWSNNATIATTTIDSTGTGVGAKTVWVKVTDANTCVNSDTMVVTFTANPIPTITGPATVKRSHDFALVAAAGYSSYLWNTGATTATLNITGNTLPPSVTLTFTCTVVNAAGCSGVATHTVYIQQDVNINETSANYFLSVYPNPTSSLFHMNIQGFVGKLDMSIVDMTGKAVYSEKLEIDNNFNKDVDVSNLAKGVYYLKMISENGVRTEKLIVQ